jgi:hypothetical protein
MKKLNEWELYMAARNMGYDLIRFEGSGYGDDDVYNVEDVLVAQTDVAGSDRKCWVLHSSFAVEVDPNGYQVGRSATFLHFSE